MEKIVDLKDLSKYLDDNQWYSVRAHDLEKLGRHTAPPKLIKLADMSLSGYHVPVVLHPELVGLFFNGYISFRVQFPRFLTKNQSEKAFWLKLISLNSVKKIRLFKPPSKYLERFVWRSPLSTSLLALEITHPLTVDKTLVLFSKGVYYNRTLSKLVTAIDFQRGTNLRTMSCALYLLLFASAVTEIGLRGWITSLPSRLLQAFFRRRLQSKTMPRWSKVSLGKLDPNYVRAVCADLAKMSGIDMLLLSFPYGERNPWLLIPDEEFQFLKRRDVLGSNCSSLETFEREREIQKKLVHVAAAFADALV